MYVAGALWRRGDTYIPIALYAPTPPLPFLDLATAAVLVEVAQYHQTLPRQNKCAYLAIREAERESVFDRVGDTVYLYHGSVQ